MAPVLQCPDCGTKHPISEVPAQGAFPCRGCGRVLRVPESVSQRAREAQPVAAAAAPVAAPAVDPAPTAVAPIVTHNPHSRPKPEPPVLPGRDKPPLGPVPWWVRLLLWLVAVPVGFVVVFGMARAFGWFTHDQLSDLFLANGTSRFWPVARILPFVALVVAGLVQGGVYGIARFRGSRRAARASRRAA